MFIHGLILGEGCGIIIVNVKIKGQNLDYPIMKGEENDRRKNFTEN